jgi:hypothetical protein
VASGHAYDRWLDAVVDVLISDCAAVQGRPGIDRPTGTQDGVANHPLHVPRGGATLRKAVL